MVDLVHQLSGKHIVYVLQCEPLDGKETRYVGTSTSIEKRTSEHLGLAKSKGASWCAKHKPVSVLEVRVCNTKEEAACMEVMLTSIHQAQVGYQHCRGGRWNMSCDMKRRPPYFNDCEFDSAESKEEEIDLPDLLPPNYEVLRDENGVSETTPPKSCPIFRDERDPDGRLRHLAGLILH